MSDDQEPWDDAWWEEDTTPSKIEAALREMLATRHHESHTRAVPILGTESRSGMLKGGVLPGPEGILRVPSAAISIFDIAVA